MVTRNKNGTFISPYEIKIGNKYNRLEIIGPVIKHKVLCKCECGKQKEIAVRYLVNNRTKSCGCLSIETTKKILTTHNKTYTRIYSIYRNMINRCYYKKSNRYYCYGARGITLEINQIQKGLK